MTCPHCGKHFNYAVMAHQKGAMTARTHIEDDIYIGDTLVHQANYDHPDVVSSCPHCWKPLQASEVKP